MIKRKKREWIMIIVGILCIFYGFLILSLNSGAKTFLIWFGMGIVLLAGAVLLSRGMWSALPAAVQKVMITLAVLVLSSFLIVEGFIVSGFFAKGAEQLDYIIVLGAQVTDHGPSMVLKYRLDKACEYLAENEHTVCIVSGGKGANEPKAEADVMKEYLLEKGIAESRIIVEAESRTTLENVSNSSAYIKKEDSVGIVTNNFHVFRGVRLARHAGIENVCGIAAKAHALYLPNNMLREYFGVLKDFGNLF